MKNKVYTISPCPFCTMAKSLLDQLGIEFEEILVTNHKEMMRLKDEYNWRTFPMVILNGKFLGGYQDVKALSDRGELDKILKG